MFRSWSRAITVTVCDLDTTSSNQFQLAQSASIGLAASFSEKGKAVSPVWRGSSSTWYLDALASGFGPDRVFRERKWPQPDWTATLGGIDIAVIHADGRLRLAGELKIEDIRRTPWDILKVACYQRQGTELGFVAAAATPKLGKANSVPTSTRRFPAHP